MSDDDIDPSAPDETPADEIGYGHPPKARRYKPGQSGNPAGRPRGAKGRRAIVERVLLEQQKVTEDGDKKTYTTLDLVLKQVLNLSYGGNSRAFKAMNKLHAEFAPKPTEWVGGLLLIPEPLTMEEWDARYGPKDQSPMQGKSEEPY